MDRAVVVGGGIAGVAIALELAERGLATTIVDDPERHPTTPVAAGMLAPSAEADFGEDLLVSLQRDALAHWRLLAPRLDAAVGHPVLFEERGTLVAAATPGDLDDLARHAELQRRFGLVAELCDIAGLYELEPSLAPHLAGGLWLPNDAQVDNRRAYGALRALAGAAGVAERTGRARALAAHHVDVDGDELDAEVVVVATGSWLAELAPIALQPVRGVTVRGALPPFLLPRHCLRGLLRGRQVYLVPRASGELVIGATAEEAPLSDTAPRGRDLVDLLSDARALLPGSSELAISDVAVGFRPRTPDNLPYVGRLAEGIWVHGGHYRNGILLAPFTARLLADAIVGERIDPRLDELAPTRTRSAA
jgi:glycine oxidase